MMRTKQRHFGLRIAECGFPWKNRSAVTLIEVLISMGVLTVGILGVAALFPVGAHYALRGDIYDRADAAAEAAFNDAVTRGLLDPERWVSYEQVESGNNTKYVWGGGFRAATRSNGTFTRPFAYDLRSRLGYPDFATETNEAKKQSGLIFQSGSVFFIDPASVASGIDTSGGANQYRCTSELRSVPASHSTNTNLTVFPSNVARWWGPWSRSAAITRLSISTRNSTGDRLPPASLSAAERLTGVTDDLATDLKIGPDEPARQLVETRNFGGGIGSSQAAIISRRAKQHFSYLVSVVPRTPEARNALAYGGRGEAYDITAVVLHRRPENKYDPADGFGGIETTIRSERICNVSATVGAPNGGVVRLFANTAISPDRFSDTTVFDENLPWKDLKEGQYVLLFGPTPSSTDNRPMLFAQWYRVVSIDNQGEDSEGKAYLGPQVALRGPDWPWQNSGIAEPDEGELGGYARPAASTVQDDLRMLIIDGAAAIHTRTMRLDSGAAWSH